MTWKGFSRCLIERGTAHLGCNVYLTRSSGHQRNLLVIVHTDQPFAGGRYFLRSSMKMAWLYSSWCHQTDILVGCKQSKKSDEGQTSDIIGPVSWVSALQLWWAVMKLDLSWNWLFQHLNFHDGCGELWSLKELGCGSHHFPGFSNQLTVGNRQVSQSQVLENATQDLGSISISGYLAV